MNKNSKIFVLCYPHLGTLDSWLPVVNSINAIASHTNFTLVIPNATIIRSFHRDNAVVKIANNIFDTVLIHAYDDTWIRHTSIFDSMKWYKNNRIILRLFDILNRLIKKKLFFYILNWPFILFRNKLYKKEYRAGIKEFNRNAPQTDILFYDIHDECILAVQEILDFFGNNRYSLPHAISLATIEQKSPVPVDIKNKININIYAYAKFQIEFYRAKYGINANKIHVVGIPRHDYNWIKTIQEESPKLPDPFDNDNTVVILSLPIFTSNSDVVFNQKVETIKNIKKIFIDKLDMRIAIKLHPNEKQGKIFAGRGDRIYENVFGLKNYGLTWIYSDLHIFTLAKGKKLTISLKTGVVFDMIAMSVPCIEHVDLSIESKNSEKYEKKLTQFVKYGFVEGASNYKELCACVDRWLSNPNQISKSSISAYKKYFPVSNDVSRKVATEILHKNEIIN